MKKIANGFETIFLWGEALAFFASIILAFLMFAKAMQPLSPVITALVVLGFTVHSMASGKLNAVGVVTGLIIYGFAWPVSHQYGIVLGMTVWSVGIMLWLVAVTRSFPRAWAAVTA